MYFNVNATSKKKDTSENKGNLILTNDYILWHSYNFEIINL